jgi:GT2 family glycosyltransferase
MKIRCNLSLPGKTRYFDMKASFICITYNTDVLCLSLLNYLNFQTYLGNFEVILVNDGGFPTLKDKILRLSLRYPLTYLRIFEDIPWNQAGAKNLGIKYASNPILIFNDVDWIPFPDCIERHIKSQLKFPKSIIYGRKIAIENENHFVTDVSQDNFSKIKPIKCKQTDRKIRKGWYYFQEAFSVKKEFVLKAGLLDEEFSGYYGYQTIDLIYRLKLLGLKMVRRRPCRYVTLQKGGTPAEFKEKFGWRNSKRNREYLSKKIDMYYKKGNIPKNKDILRFNFIKEEI